MYILNAILAAALLTRFFEMPIWLVVPAILLAMFFDLMDKLDKIQKENQRMGSILGKLKFIAEQVIRGK